MKKDLYTLRIDPIFKNLIRPLHKDEYEQLEDNLIKDGCLDPIIVWEGTIIDGHNRYEICTKHKIPFALERIHFKSAEDAIVWICNHQLGRRNLTVETQKYLIGKRYHAEKSMSARNILGTNQYSMKPKEDDDAPYELFSPPEKLPQEARVGTRTAERLGDEYHLSYGTVQKYAKFSQAIDKLQEIEPKMVPRILSGRFKFSHDNVLEMAKMKPEEVRRIRLRLEKEKTPFSKYNETRDKVEETKKKALEASGGHVASVKDMPAYDPDAEVTALTLTVPVWTKSIDRTRTKTDLTAITQKARRNLEEALLELQLNIEQMLIDIKEE